MAEQFNGKWIPVSEQLPVPGIYVLVTTKQKPGTRIIRIGMWSGTNYGWSTGGATRDVIAWMPLPEPYNEDPADE